MTAPGHLPLPTAQAGVVLLEALIAILIFSFAVLGIVGMEGSMIKNTSDSKFRADASYIAQQTLGRMWADPANLASYVETDADISTLLPSGTRTVANTAGTNEYTITIKWQQPGESQHNFTTVARIDGGV